jgi:hypothetical protein
MGTLRAESLVDESDGSQVKMSVALLVGEMVVLMVGEMVEMMVDEWAGTKALK